MDSLSQAGAATAQAQKRTEASCRCWESRAIQKMKNSGNEAKKCLKTKNIAFLKGAHFACFVRKLRPI
jgi:hypothetical protein